MSNSKVNANLSESDENKSVAVPNKDPKLPQNTDRKIKESVPDHAQNGDGSEGSELTFKEERKRKFLNRQEGSQVC